MTDESAVPEAAAAPAPASPAPPPQDTAGLMASLASAAPAPDVIRQAPEYLALAEQNRQLARDAGNARAEAERYRLAAEQARQAAEAARVAAVQREMAGVLGQNAPAFAELWQLMQSDPANAARRFAELMAAQSVQPPVPPPAPVAQPGVPAPQAPPPPLPQNGIAAQPLGVQSATPLEDQVTAYQNQFGQVAQANSSLATRVRVRARERAGGVAAWLKGQYLEQHGIDPDLTFARGTRTRE